MSNQLHKALTAALLNLLKPLARLLLRHGMAYGTFAELARKAYVDAAFEDAQTSGKRPTISSVSAVTGLTRKETKRLRDLNLVDDESSAQRYSRAIRVISGWLNDPRFHDENGDPATLAMEDGESSFSVLVKDYSGDIPPAAMFAVLESSGSVSSTDEGVVLEGRAYIPSDTPLDKINILGTDVSELIATIGHNLDSTPAEAFFQRKVSNVLLRADALEDFREMSNLKSQQLLEEYHAWLSAHEVDTEDLDGADDQESCYVAVGIYYTQRDGNNEESV